MKKTGVADTTKELVSATNTMNRLNVIWTGVLVGSVVGAVVINCKSFGVVGFEPRLPVRPKLVARDAISASTGFTRVSSSIIVSSNCFSIFE
jgi:hypothetical protein